MTFKRENANYLTRAIGSEGNRRTWTYSCWIKKHEYGADRQQLWGQVATSDNTATGKWQLYWTSSDGLNIHTHSLSHLITNASFRDTGWYHVVQTLDTTSNSADSRVRMYINGVELTSFSTRNNPSQNAELGVNTVGNMVIGTADNAKSTYYISAEMTQAQFVDGLQLGPGYFGFTDPITGTWRPKKFRAEGTTVNDGTTWSDGWTGTVMSGYNYTESFDGTLGSDANNSTRPDVNQTITWTNPKGSTPFENLKLWCINDGGDAIVKVNGYDVTNQVGPAGYSNVGWYEITGVGNELATIQLIAGSSNAPYLWGVEIDGVTMVDSTTTNLDYGTNGFYLPMDGNSPIGEDKSGKGNDFTPQGFGGSVTLDNPNVSGARPVLNTIQGGTQVAPGVFGSRENRTYTVTSWW